MQSQQILMAIKQLINKGITPSVATIKGNVGQAVPLPAIISALKQWQANPDIIEGIEVEVKLSEDKSPALQSTADETQRKLELMQQEIVEIKTLLKEVLVRLSTNSNKPGI